ncbi:hypothetical protein EB118_01735 [bacterium]|nr:hypothetical protein [bacterium]NBX97947.1 hypothetical protein [bacterium]NDC94625.1 hypothetical protein [bacterium]NDD83784.1 hypothetical protein [bacterium]NDG28809.1 hypothetical protein [bacterium]
MGLNKLQPELDNQQIVERLHAFGKSEEEILQLLGGFSLFLSGEADVPPLPKNTWVDDEDLPLVENDERVKLARLDLELIRKVKGEDTNTIERSRSTEWYVLLEKFISVIPIEDKYVA